VGQFYYPFNQIDESYQNDLSETQLDTEMIIVIAIAIERGTLIISFLKYLIHMVF